MAHRSIGSLQPALLTNYSDRHLPVSRTLVEIAENDLLPGAYPDTTVRHRVTLRRAHERAAQMRVSVLISPPGVVRIVGIGRSNLFESALEIGYTARLKFQRGDAQSRAYAGNVDHPRSDPALRYDARDFRGDIEYVAMAARSDREFLLEDRHGYLPNSASKAAIFPTRRRWRSAPEKRACT